MESKINLDELVEYLEDVHKYTGYYMALCPFHDDHTPSLRVSRMGYFCLSGCGGGSLEKLYSHVTGKFIIKDKPNNPYRWIWKNWQEKFGSKKELVRIAHEQLLFNQELGNFLQQRKIDKFIQRGKLGYVDGYYIFPVFTELGELDGVIARASPTIQSKQNRYFVHPDCQGHLYIPNWDRTLKSDAIYVCYGTVDVWTLESCGYAGVTGLSGQSLKAEYLDRFRKPIYIIPDKKEENSSLILMSRLGWRGMMLLLQYPDGTKDLNDVHVRYGIDTVSKLIEQAKEKYQYGRATSN